MDAVSLHAGERVILKLGKHPLVLVGKLIPYAFLDYLPYLLPTLGAWLSRTNPSTVVDFAATLSFENPWVRFIVGIYWLFVWMGAFGVFTDYFLDKWVVTSERIIDINQKSFWSREVGSLFLHRVQNVETDVSGFFNTVFGFGTVSVESAGAEVNRIRMTGLARPEYVRDVILKEVNRHETERPVARVGL
jgi:membrane protein YdbS with pleckstrin-like domain